MNTEETLKYEDLTAHELFEILTALQEVEDSGLRNTHYERQFVLKGIAPAKLVAVSRLLKAHNGMRDALSGR